MLQQAINKRVVKKTEKNDDSSRSHLLFKLIVNNFDKNDGKNSTGTLVLVDLAGSERLNESKTYGESFKETQHINKSLSSLGDVMSALYRKENYIPFRNSKLTLLLQDYLIGDSKAVMIVNLSSDEQDFNSTLTSLNFAKQVKKVEKLNKKGIK